MAFIDTIVDYRYNPFTGVFTPNPIGYASNPVENKTIPATSPYYVYLDELPREDSPSTLIIKQTGTSNYFTEVSKTTTPAAGQFRVIYGGDGITTTGAIGQGIVEFNAIDTGKDLDIQYYGLGSILQSDLFIRLYDEQFLWSIIL